MVTLEFTAGHDSALQAWPSLNKKVWLAACWSPASHTPQITQSGNSSQHQEPVSHGYWKYVSNCTMRKRTFFTRSKLAENAFQTAQ